MDFKNKLLTLSDNVQYVIIEDIMYDGKNYVLASEVEDNELAPGKTVFRIETVNGEPKFIEEHDLNILESVLTQMAYHSKSEMENENV